MDLLDLFIKILVDDQASDAIEGMSTKAVAKGNIIANAFSFAMNAVSSSIDSAVRRVDTMNTFPIVMENLGISSNEAQASVDRLSEKLSGLPTALDTAVSGVKRFTSANGDVAKSTEYFLAMNNAIIAGGADMGTQASAVEQLSQAYAKGSMDIMEWRSLQQAMPAQLNQVAQSFGMTATELREAIKDGSVSMDDFMGKIVELNENGGEGFASFEEQARGATGGIATQVANMNTAITRSVANIIDAFNENGAINKAIQSFTGAISAIGNTIVPIAQEVGARVAELVDAIGEAFAPLAKDMQSSGREIAKVFGAIASAVTEVVKAISPLLPTIAKLAPLLLAAHSAAGLLSGSITSLSEKAMPMLFQAGMNGSKAADKMLVSMSGLSSFAVGPMVAAITAAVAVIGLLVVAFMDAQERQEQFEKATTGLVNASQSLKSSSELAAESMKGVGDAASDGAEGVGGYVLNVDELIQKQAELAETMQKQFTDTNENNALLQSYSDKIIELAGNCGDSAEKVAELQANINGYNDLAGTAISITDEHSGAINISTEALQANTEAWQANARAKAAQEMYQDAYKAEIEAKTAMVDANERLAQAQAELNGITADGETDMTQYTSRVAEAERQVNEATAAHENAEKSVSNLTNALNEDTQTANAAKSKLDALCESNEGLRDVLGLTTAAIGEQAASLEQLTEELKEQLDAQYDAQKESFNEAYKALQKALSAEEKEFSRHNDKEYKALKKALDAEYDELKKSLDKQYDAKKENLDKQYDTLKKSLDKQLDAVKKSNDKQLDSLKKSQSEQVKAFKKATEERIAAIDEEYKAKLKLLDLEKSEREKEIDDQIAAINGQAKEEEKAHKKAAQDKKIAELKQTMETGKTYKERKAAAEELEEYLAEIEQERIDEERQALIDNLEQQKDTIDEEIDNRKDALSEEAEARKEAVQTSREAELEAIQEANDKEYEKLKESLEAKENAIKESNDKKLEALKKSQNDELEAIKQSNADQLEALKEGHSDQLEELKLSHQDQEEELRNTHSEQLEETKRAQSEALEELKKSNEEQLEEFKKGRTDITAETSGMASDVAQDAEEGGKGIKDAFEKAEPVITDKVEGIRNAVKSKFGLVPGDMEDSASDGGQKFADAIDGSESNIENSVNNIKNAVNRIFGTLPTDGESTGRNLSNGFVNGMYGVDIYNAAWRVGQSALNAIKNALGISSPSKEARKLFQMVAQGAALGIEDDADLVAKSAADMAESAMESAENALSEPMSMSIEPKVGIGSEGGLSGMGISITGNTFVVREEADIDRIADQLLAKIKREQEARSWKPSYSMA